MKNPLTVLNHTINYSELLLQLLVSDMSILTVELSPWEVNVITGLLTVRTCGCNILNRMFNYLWLAPFPNLPLSFAPIEECWNKMKNIPEKRKQINALLKKTNKLAHECSKYNNARSPFSFKGSLPLI